MLLLSCVSMKCINLKKEAYEACYEIKRHSLLLCIKRTLFLKLFISSLCKTTIYFKIWFLINSKYSFFQSVPLYLSLRVWIKYHLDVIKWSFYYEASMALYYLIIDILVRIFVVIFIVSTKIDFFFVLPLIIATKKKC